MKDYRALPVEVTAAEIRSGGERRPDGSRLLLLEHDETRLADANMLARYTPVAGDYWVIQQDGYSYINPKAVFERKYKEL